jgi:branched-chain amino acid transport system substrate-binding protein
MVAAATAGAAEDPSDSIKIGLIGSFSGTFADQGERMKNGAETYMREHGDTVAGKKIVLVTRDDGGSQPPTAKRQALDLIAHEKIAFLTGFGFTANALAVADVVTEAKIPTILMNAAGEHLTAKSPYFIRLSFSQSQIAAPVGTWMAENGLKSTFLAIADFGPGHDLEKAFLKTYTASGGKVAGSVYMPLDSVEFAPFVQRVADAKPESVFLFHGEPTNFVKEFVQLGLKKSGIKLVGGTEIVDDTVADRLGDDALGMLSTQVYSYTHQSALNQRFVRDFAAAYGAHPQPNFMTVAGYDAMAAIYQVIAKLNGVVDPDKAMEAFKGLAFESPRGPIEIDPETRDIVETVYIRRVDRVNGELVNTEIAAFPRSRGLP